MRPKPSQHHRGAGPVRPRDDETPPLFGVHAVEAALRNPRRTIHRLYATENAERRLAEVLRDRGIEIERVSPRDLDRRLGADTVHQGVLLEVEPLPDVSLEDLAAHAVEGPLVALDQVTDPHNVGAVLRSAAVFGASGLILTRRHSPPLGGTLAKSASGALDLVPVALVANLARALDELGEAGITRIGLDGAGPNLLEDEPLKQPTVLVLGAEGRGLRQLTRETCDRLCRILSSGAIESLNVSNAAAVALHVCAMQRRTRSP